MTAMHSREWDDDAVLADLRAAAAFAGPTDRTVAAGVAAFTWRTIDEELDRAGLVFDSLLAGTTRAAADDSARVLVFERDSITVEVEVDAGHITGQVVPATTGTIEVQTPDGVAARTGIEDFGSFRVEVRTRGPMRLRVHAAAGSVVTDWFPGPH